MILDQRYVGGVVRERWTDDAGGTYYELAADGVTVTSQRPFTAVELAWLADLTAAQTSIANAKQFLADGQAGIDLALAKLASLPLRNDKPDTTRTPRR